MDSKPQGFFGKLFHSLGLIIRSLFGRVSKLFDRIIYDNRLSLLFSFIFALAMCISINYTDLQGRFFKNDSVTLNMPNIPVEVFVDTNAYEVTGVPSVADITIEGDTADIQLVRTQNSAAITADLRQLTEGTSEVTLEVSGLPTGLTVKVNPSTVQATLAKKYTKTFFVSPDLIVGNGQSPNAYNEPTLSSRSVTVRATRDKLNSIRSIRAIVDTSSYEGEFTADVPLVAYDGAGKQVNVSITPETVQATVTLVQNNHESTSKDKDKETSESKASNADSK
ncbi:MAG: CdaR family protein [Erysipelotrichaceae bacterium]|nr:CdaR family protein [Erysipelotrichaceae bacterium]